MRVGVLRDDAMGHGLEKRFFPSSITVPQPVFLLRHLCAVAAATKETTLRKRFIVITEAAQMNKRVRPVPFHTHDRKIPAEVASVGSRNRKAVAEAGQRRARVEVRLAVADRACLHVRVRRREQVRPCEE